MQNGSSWNIWDLHVHTPYSALNNQFGDPTIEKTWENYVSHLEETTQKLSIVALGVTDYFTIEGYTRLLDYQKKGRLQNVLLIPNIEFRIDKIVYREKEATSPKRLNLHVLISPSYLPIYIQEHFLDDLDFVHEQEPFQPANIRPLKRSNLTDFGTNLQNQHEKFKGRDPFEIGCLNAIVNSEKIKEILENRFHGNYLLVLAEESLPLLDWDSQHHAIRKQLLQMSHAVFSSNEKTRAFCLGLTHLNSTDFIKEFKSLKPCLWGCDSHGYDDRFLSPEEDRFCWIKSDVSWEGLKQIIFEPSERVVIQKTNPEPTKSIFTIKSVGFPRTTIRQSLSIAPSNIQFNPNLIVIIGGRGSGKTALLDLIGSCFYEGDKLSNISTSFIYRLYKEEPPPGEGPSQPVLTTLKFISGDVFTKQVGTEENYFDATDIVYLTQNHFDEYSADPDKLNHHIIDLVFENYAEEKRQFDLFENTLQDTDRQLEELNLQIEHLSNEIDQRKLPEIEQQKIYLGRKIDIEKRIAEIETTQGKQAEQAKTLSEKLDYLISLDADINSAKQPLEQLKTIINNFLEQYNISVDDANAGIKLARDAIGKGRIKSLPTVLKELNIVMETVNHDISELSTESLKVSASLQEAHRHIAELNGLDKILADHREMLSNISIQISTINNQINETIENERRLSSLINFRTEVFAEAMLLTIRLKTFFQSTIEKFRSESPCALENIRFDAKVDIKDFSTYIQNLALQLDNRVYSEEDLKNSLELIIQRIESHFNSDANKEDFLADSRDLYSSIASLRTKKSVTISDYGNAVFKRFFKVGITLKYSGKRMVDLSMGERAIILLKILLSLGDKPLLIDQPEEHLDNRFVFDDLTPAFREAKKKRQIFIATHNANLAVNTDAEQIIIADNTSGVLSYKLGTLEDLKIRDAIKIILEGGDEAFRKREQRYGYMF